MSKIFFPFLVVALLLTSCSSPLFAPPTPTATLTFTPSPTATLTSTPSLTPSPAATQTLIPTETATLSPNSIQSRGEFEERVKSGSIKCQGSMNGGPSELARFMDEATAAGILPKAKYILGSGIPSTDDPSQCLFLITFGDGNKTIIYKDSETGEFVALFMVD